MTTQTTPTPESVKALADGLTKAQRLVLIAGGGSTRTVNKLIKMGLVASVIYHSDCAIVKRWSHLGDAVAAHIGASHD